MVGSAQCWELLGSGLKDVGDLVLSIKQRLSCFWRSWALSVPCRYYNGRAGMIRATPWGAKRHCIFKTCCCLLPPNCGSVSRSPAVPCPRWALELGALVCYCNKNDLTLFLGCREGTEQEVGRMFWHHELRTGKCDVSGVVLRRAMIFNKGHNRRRSQAASERAGLSYGHGEVNLKRQICESPKATMHRHTGQGHDAPPRFGDASLVVLGLGLR